MKKNKGITLVALVITIIILLILAGITIAQLTGSGLFENTRLAEEKSKEAQEKEDKILNEYESLIKGSNRENKNYNSNIYDEWTTWLYLAGIENPENYNEIDILSDETIITKLMNSEQSIEYMLKSKYFILPAVCRSEMTCNTLAKYDESVKRKLISSQNFCKEIVNSEYKDNFSEYIVYNENTKLGVAVGRSYYKKNEGFALAGSFYVNGPQFILIGRSEDDVIGYCSYNTSVLSTATSFAYNGETWYYSMLPYGFNDGGSVSSHENSKYLGTLTNYSNEEVAIYILDDFFGNAN